MTSLMDFDAKYREKYSSQSLPLYIPDSFSKPRDDFSLDEGAFSTKSATCFLQDLNTLENFNLNGSSSSSSNNAMFSVQPTCLDPFDHNSTFGCLPNFDFYETKPFDSHGSNNCALIPLMDNFNQSGGIAILGHSQMVAPINLVSPNAQGHNPFSYHELSSSKFRLADESSCSSPKVDTIMSSKPFSSTNMARKGGRGRKKKPNVVKGQWTIEEDRMLVQLVERYGVRKWSQIAQMLNGRIGKQCRERWHNHLRPDIKKDLWSEEEDRILIKSHAEIGNKWAEIAKKLPGRTENSIKNHWNATKRRQFSRRKCRTKYPRQSSLLQEYIKSLDPETINAGCRKKQPSTTNYASSVENNANSTIDQLKATSDSNSSERLLGQDYDFMNDVPDFNFDAQLLDESSIDSLLDGAPNNDHNEINFGYDDEDDLHHQHLAKSSSESQLDSHIDFDPMMHYEVKKELDLVEMINQVNL